MLVKSGVETASDAVEIAFDEVELACDVFDTGNSGVDSPGNPCECCHELVQDCFCNRLNKLLF